MLCLTCDAAAQNPPPAWGPQTWDETMRRAANLARAQPATAWEQVITADAVDLIESIGPDRILTGYVDISRLGEPNHDHVVLASAADGSVIWSADRPPYQRGTYSLFRSTPHIVLLGSDAATFSLIALDTATGKRVWQRQGRAPFQLALGSGERYLVLSGEGKRTRLEAMDARTGRVLWKRDIPEAVAAESTAARLLMAGDTAIVVGRQVLEIDVADGAALRTIAPRAAGSDAPNALLAPRGGIVLWTEGLVEWIDRASGRSGWVVGDSAGMTGSGALRVVSLDGDDVIRIGYRDATRTSVVDRLRSADGTRAWRYAVRGIVVSPLVRDSSGVMAFATDSTLVGFDAATGTHRFQQTFPADFAAGGPSYARRVGMPDIVEQRAGKVFIGRERAGVIAYELPAGRMLWFQRNYERPIPALDYTAQGRFDYMTFIMALQGRTRPGGPPSLSTFSSGGGQRQAFMLQSAQRDYQAARARYDALRFDPGASRADRSTALGRVRFAADQQVAQAEIQASLNKMAASLELGMNALNFAFGLMIQTKQRMQAGLEARALLVVLGGAKARDRVFQDDYYVWPFYKRGRGVTLVSLETGKRRDIVVSPHSEALLAFSVDYPVFRIAGNQLLAAGMSLRPERYVDQNQWKLTKAPNLSLLGYDLDSIAMIDRTRDWSWLADVTRGGDQTMMTGFLDRGEVDVNARHWAAGETALMFAAAAGRVDLARLLVGRGADVNAVSDLGQTALDIAKVEPMREYLRSVGATPGSP